jgi:hypothetical protein
MADFFTDYLSVSKGLTKLKITVPTDFQQQLLEIESDLHNLIITAPEDSGKMIGLTLLALKKFINE